MTSPFILGPSLCIVQINFFKVFLDYHRSVKPPLNYIMCTYTSVADAYPLQKTSNSVIKIIGIHYVIGRWIWRIMHL